MTPLQRKKLDPHSIHHRRNSSDAIIDDEKDLMEILPPDKLKKALKIKLGKGNKVGAAPGGGDDGDSSSSDNSNRRSVSPDEEKEDDQYDNEAAKEWGRSVRWAFWYYDRRYCTKSEWEWLERIIKEKLETGEPQMNVILPREELRDSFHFNSTDYANVLTSVYNEEHPGIRRADNRDKRINLLRAFPFKDGRV